MKTPETVYDIYLVPNGRMTDFRNGILGKGYPDECKCWGEGLDLDDVRQRYRELADENYMRDGGEYDRIWDECAKNNPEQEPEGYVEPAIAHRKYLDELTADPDPLNWARIEWNDDLQWVCIRARTEIVTSTPVWTIRQQGEFVESNPCRLTPYVTVDGEIWLHSEGNGNGDDEMLPNIEDMTDDEAWEAIAEYDVSAMRSDADEIAAAGDTETADWLRGWCDRAESVQRGREVDEETYANAMHELRENGHDDEADEIESVREVWSDETSTIYRTDTDVYFMLSDGSPTFFDGVAEARKQIF